MCRGLSCFLALGSPPPGSVDVCGGRFLSLIRLPVGRGPRRGRRARARNLSSGGRCTAACCGTGGGASPPAVRGAPFSAGDASPPEVFLHRGPRRAVPYVVGRWDTVREMHFPRATVPCVLFRWDTVREWWCPRTTVPSGSRHVTHAPPPRDSQTGSADQQTRTGRGSSGPIALMQSHGMHGSRESLYR